MDLLPQVRHLKSPSHAKPTLSIGTGDIERLQAAHGSGGACRRGPAFGRLRWAGPLYPAFINIACARDGAVVRGPRSQPCSRSR
jgi:hypothetical protein